MVTSEAPQREGGPLLAWPGQDSCNLGRVPRAATSCRETPLIQLVGDRANGCALLVPLPYERDDLPL